MGNLKQGTGRISATNQWVKDGLKTSAMILVVTGLGGSLSEILKGTPAVDFIAGIFVAYGLPSILLLLVFGFAAGPGRLGLVDPGVMFGSDPRILLTLVSVAAALGDVHPGRAGHAMLTAPHSSRPGD